MNDVSSKDLHSNLFGEMKDKYSVLALNVDQISPDPNQPRKHFDKAALKELAATIKEKGLIQPIIIRSNPDDVDGYIIIAGERRWRAAQLNKAQTIEVVVRNDLDARSASLIENIQRQNLKPVEEAEAVATLIEEDNLSQSDVATMLGMGKATISQLLKIRSLPEEVRLESIALDTPKTILVELSGIKNDKLVNRLWKRGKQEALSVADIRRVRDAAKKSKEEGEEAVKLTVQERMIRKVFEGLEGLKDKPLSEAERGRLMELQATFVALLDGKE